MVRVMIVKNFILLSLANIREKYYILVNKI